MFYMKIICNTKIFTKLNLQCNSFFHKIDLIICTQCNKSPLFYYPPLFFFLTYTYNFSCNKSIPGYIIRCFN